MDANEFLARQRSNARETFEVVDGTIVNPCYRDHKLARNWAAIVTRDYAGSPGGLHRTFFEHGPKNRVFVPTELKAGDSIEFGGDKVPGGLAKKKVNRRYYAVIEVQPEAVVARPITFEEIGAGQGDAVAAPGDHHDPETAEEPVDERNPLSGFSDEEIWEEAVRRNLIKLGDEAQN